MKQRDRFHELEQDIGLRRPAPAAVPLSPASASSSAVTRQPAFFSCCAQRLEGGRTSCLSSASRSSTSGVNGAPGSSLVLSTSPSSGSWTSSAPSMVSAIVSSAVWFSSSIIDPLPPSACR